jgi:hypothetical protein
MNHESLMVVPHPSQIDKVVVTPAAEAPAPPDSRVIADPEHQRAAEAVFAARQQESDTVIGLLGLWTGVALLNDLAIETFSEPAGEVEAEENEKPKPKA